MTWQLSGLKIYLIKQSCIAPFWGQKSSNKAVLHGDLLGSKVTPESSHVWPLFGAKMTP